MNEQNVRIAKNTGYLFFRMLLLTFVIFYTSRLVLSGLGVENYGIYNVVGGIGAVLTLFNSAMSSTTRRYVAYELGLGQKGDVNRVFGNCLLIQIMNIVFFVLLAELIGPYLIDHVLKIPYEKVAQAHVVFQITVLYCCLMIWGTAFYGAILAYERMKMFAYLSVVEVGLRLLTAITIVYIRQNQLIAYAILQALSELAIVSFYFLYCRFYIKEIRLKLVFDKKKIVEMFKFSSYAICSEFCNEIKNQGVNLILGAFFSPVVNAARAISRQVEAGVVSLAYNFQYAVNPQITKTYAQKNRQRFTNLIQRSSLYSFYLLFYVAIPILFDTDFILHFWLKEVPEHSSSFIRILICAALIIVLQNPLDIGVFSTGRIKSYQLISSGINLALVPISILTFTYYAYPELIYLIYFTISLVVYAYKLWYTSHYQLIGLKSYLGMVLVRVVTTTSVALALVFAIRHYFEVTNFMDFVVILVVYVLAYSLVVFVIGLNRKERGYIKTYIRKRIK